MGNFKRQSILERTLKIYQFCNGNEISNKRNCKLIKILDKIYELTTQVLTITLNEKIQEFKNKVGNRNTEVK